MKRWPARRKKVQPAKPQARCRVCGAVLVLVSDGVRCLVCQPPKIQREVAV